MKYSWYLKAAFFIALFLLAKTFLVYYLWNWLIPTVFDGPVINLWQALGFMLLAKVLFGFGGRWGGNKHNWKEKMKEKFENMSPEERERYKTEMYNRCGKGWFKESKPTHSEDVVQ